MNKGNGENSKDKQESGNKGQSRRTGSRSQKSQGKSESKQRAA